jgi:hypothetical protein
VDLLKIQEHFKELVIEESRGMFKPDEMRVVDLSVLREIKKVFMPVPGMYGVSVWAYLCRMPIDLGCCAGVQCAV